LTAAGQSISGAFDNFRQIIQERQAIDLQNAAAVEDGNKQAYLDALQGASTPEELAALQASGNLKSQFQALSAVNRGQVRGALDARGNSLVNAQRAAQEFTFKVNKAGFEADANTRAQQTAAEQATRAPIELRDLEQRTATGKQSVLESQQRVKASQEDSLRNLTNGLRQDFARHQTAYTATQEKLGRSVQGVVGTPEGMKSLLGTLAGVFKDKDPQALLDATTFVNKAIARNPAFASLPTDVVENIVLSRADDFGRTFGPPDFILENYINKSMTEALKTSAPRMLANENQRTSLIELLKRQRLLLDNAQAEAFPDLEKAIAARAGRITDGGGAPDPVTGAPTGVERRATVVPAPSAVPPQPAASPIEKRVAQENSDLNQGKIDDFSPDVKKYMTEKLKRDSREARQAAELTGTRDLEKERALAVAKSREQLRYLRPVENLR